MNKKKLLSIVTATLLLLTVFAGCGGSPEPAAPAADTPAPAAPAETAAPAEPAADGPVDVNNLPREETLYFGGQQWGTVNGWNPYSGDNNNALGITENSAARIPVFETLYMYNQNDGKAYPLLADGDYVWNDDVTQLTVKIKPAAKWNDGTPVTADDVVYTWDSHVKYQTGNGSNYADVLAKVEKIDDLTVVFHAVLDESGKAVNPLRVVDYVDGRYVIQKAFTEALEARSGGDADKFKNDPCEDIYMPSGPYKGFYSDDQKVVYIRNDNYWGQDASMWGSLPVPKYLCHTIYADNAAVQVAFAAGEIDVNQQFIANVQDLWLKDGLPISTYIDKAPYGECVNMPTAWFNMKSYGLDNIAVRKAIAIAVDYDAINQNAMTGQSPTFDQVPRSIMNPTEGEQMMYNRDDPEIKALQWVGNDIEGANKLLDEAGIVDTDGDGWRELDGKKLEYNANCPDGWTDWQASMEIVAAAGKNIGIDITTNYPDWAVYQTVVTSGGQTEYDIFMMWTESAGPTLPWARARQFLDSKLVGMQGNWIGNYGQYSNPRADEILAAIPAETDMEKLKELYTEAVKIYLTDVPSFSLMYRPNLFHAVNESVWTNFPEKDDGRNIPPTVCTDGYGIAALYDLTLVG